MFDVIVGRIPELLYNLKLHSKKLQELVFQIPHHLGLDKISIFICTWYYTWIYLFNGWFDVWSCNEFNVHNLL